MKYALIIACFLWSFAIMAQSPKVVFDVTSSNTDVHESTLRHVKGMSKAYPKGKFEVVVYSGALNMLLQDKSTVAADIASFADNPNVDFVVCAMTMKRHDIN
ncbi:MAG: hypothetical protein R3345_09170, partial [Fulvivirga sp.]|nr:hypothetical protein [Fulvivirga sp.]